MTLKCTCNTNKVHFKHVISPCTGIYLKYTKYTLSGSILAHKSTLNTLKVELFYNLITTKIYLVQN